MVMRTRLDVTFIPTLPVLSMLNQAVATHRYLLLYLEGLMKSSWSNFIRNVKVKWSRYRPGVAQRVGRGIAHFHDSGTRRGWVVSSSPRLQYTPGKDLLPILQEAGWAPSPGGNGEISHPHRDSIPDRPARSQSLYRLSYRYKERRSLKLNAPLFNVLKKQHLTLTKFI